MKPGSTLCRCITALTVLVSSITVTTRSLDTAHGIAKANVASRAAVEASHGRNDSLIITDFTFAPGATVARRNHSGFALLYVLSGTIRSQRNDGHTTQYAAGQGWVEPPGAEQASMDNPDPARSAHLLAIFIARVGGEATL